MASHFGVSVPTIRLDRLELGIPELRERIKAMATEHAQDEQPEPIQHEIVGELIDVTEGKQALSMLHTTPDMEDRFGYIDPQYLYASSKFLGQASYGFNPLLCRGGEILNIKIQ